ncbi:MAG: DNA polymerase III subunit delta [Acidimicrobiales bacterium]
MTAPAGGPARPTPYGAAWIVEGNDAVLVAERARALVSEILDGADPALCVEEFGPDADLATVVDACRTVPMFADRRVVVLRDLGERLADEVAPLVAYLADPSPSAALVVVPGAGRPPASLVAAFKAHARVVSTTVSARDAREWVRGRVARSPVGLDKAAETLVAEHLGEDISRLPALLAVLAAAYPAGGTLGAADVEPYLGEAGSVVAWDLTDALDRGDAEAALTTLHRLLGAGGRHPLVILAVLTRHYQSVLRVDSPAICTEGQAAGALGIAKGRSTYPAKKALTTARRLGPSGVAGAICLLADADVALKGAQEWPGALVLEVLVARLCRLARSGGRLSPPDRHRLPGQGGKARISPRREW